MRNIASMRWVTAKPPNILTAVSTRATTAMPRIHASGRTILPSKSTEKMPWVSMGGAICTSAPMAMMLEMALVTLISGVCSDGVTFHTTM